jgi:hypothetical protein
LYEVTNVLGGTYYYPLQDRSESNWEQVDHIAVASARDGEVEIRSCPCQKGTGNRIG